MDKEFWANKGFEAFRIILGNTWNRLGSVIAVAGVGALTGWVEKFVMAYSGHRWEETEQWIGWTLLAVGIAMVAYGVRKARSPNPNDVELIQQFHATFRQSDLEFLMDPTFAGTWHVNQTRCFEDIVDDWIGAKYEFTDKKLNKLLKRVKELSRDLAAEEVNAHGIGPTKQIRTLSPGGTPWEMPRDRQEKIDRMNRLARELAEAVNALERAAKLRLPPPPN